MQINLSGALQCSTNVQVEARWDPIADSTFNLHEASPIHAELFDFSPSLPTKEYEVDDFRVFLPSSAVEIGDVWQLESHELMPFLHQFHPGATTALHNGREGACACLRAISSDYAEIAFRIHAELVLSSDAYEAWRGANSLNDEEGKSRYILSQFAGRLVINLKRRSVRAFSLYLPPRNSNVDIGAFEEVDMVFVPRMELLAANTDDYGEIAWDDAITAEEARKKLELNFYKFSEIDWLPIDEAVAQAEVTNLPVHAILVWGALDDESC